MDAKTEEGEGRENSSPLKETVRIQFVHQRDIGIARARVRILRPSISTLFIGAKKTHSSLLRFIHGTGALSAPHPARQSVFGRRVSLHHSHSLLLSPPLLSFPNSAKALSPPIQCNTLQSNPPFLLSPSYCFAGPVHDVILVKSTSLRFKGVAYMLITL